MIKRLNLKDGKVVKQILSLQMIAYKVEGELIGFLELPPLKDTLDSLKDCDEKFYGYYMNDVLVGIISYKTIGDMLDIHRLAVHPAHFRMGIGKKLINFVEGIEDAIKKVVVSTGKENFPAVNLYLKEGYHKTKDIEIRKNIYLTAFEKILLR